MGKFTKKCQSCGVKLYYEYGLDERELGADKDIGKKRLGEYKCFACSRDYTPEIAKELFGEG